MRLVALCIVLAGCEPPGYHKGGDEPDAAPADGSTDGAHAIDAAPDATTPGTCVDNFRLDGHGAASTCWVTGDWVAWGVDPDHGAIALTKGSDGAWTGSHAFTAGTYQYKFVVDATMWIPDPNDPDVVDDGFGGHNSVYTCTP